MVEPASGPQSRRARQPLMARADAAREHAGLVEGARRAAPKGRWMPERRRGASMPGVLSNGGWALGRWTRQAPPTRFSAERLRCRGYRGCSLSASALCFGGCRLAWSDPCLAGCWPPHWPAVWSRLISVTTPVAWSWWRPRRRVRKLLAYRRRPARCGFKAIGVGSVTGMSGYRAAGPPRGPECIGWATNGSDRATGGG